MPTRIPLSAGWRFLPGSAGSGIPESERAQLAADRGEPVDLPHCFGDYGPNYPRLPSASPDSRNHIGLYVKEFSLPDRGSGGSVHIEFEGVAVKCRIWIDGIFAGSHDSPYLPFAIPVPQQSLNDSGTHLLVVEVDGSEDPDLPPFGNVVDYLVYPGMYRGVWLSMYGAAGLHAVHARPLVEEIDPSGRTGRARLAVKVETRLDPAFSLDLRVEAKLREKGKVVAHAACGESGALDFGLLECIELWDVENPCLYTLEIVLSGKGGDFDGQVLDTFSQCIGFRSARWTPEGFFLNGRRLFLRGLNRHQCYPYSGAAMGPGGQRADAAYLKRELGLSMVRSSHYPPSRHFLDACDELGLLVFEELPGWQHIGGSAWKDRSLKNLGAMILRDRHHPSIVLWGTRINESPDDHDFYSATAKLARSLDPDRAIGGVRCIKKSELLEDVYTFNDFTCDAASLSSQALADPGSVLGRDVAAPYLVTEHNGHMFPVKRFDFEGRLVEQAERHARVLDTAMGDSRISGALGWCAFDYHTHSQFGSGDGVCYHGVADLFRIPKPAAALYASQADPDLRPVLEIGSGFHPGEHPAFRILPIRIFTNCDEVRLYRGGAFVGSFNPDRARFPHLAHPPVLIDDLIGDVIGARLEAEGFSPKQKALFLKLASRALQKGAAHLSLLEKLQFSWLLISSRKTPAQVENLVASYAFAMGGASAEFELVGMLGGKEVIRKKAGSDSQAGALILRPDEPKLAYVPGDEWDATRIEARLVDQYGVPCRYAFEPIEIKLEGPGRLIGPSTISLISGSVAFWVATSGKPAHSGKIDIEARCGRHSARVVLDVETIHG